MPCGFVVLKSGVMRPPDQIERELVALVREKIGPVAAQIATVATQIRKAMGLPVILAVALANRENFLSRVMGIPCGLPRGKLQGAA